MLAGTNATLMRSYNARVVIELIRRAGDATRAEIARDAGLSLQGVSTIFGRLEDEGWIVEHGRRSISRGQPPLVYRLNAAGRAMIGVSVDLDGVTSATVDLMGVVHARRHTPLPRPSPEQARVAILDHVLDLERAAIGDGRSVIGVGVAIPGTPEPATGVVRNLPHLDGWNDVDLLEFLRSDLQLPVHLANDAIAAALGETWFGDGPNGTTFYVFFAHGLNGAVIEGRRPFGGIWGITGKFGHIPVVADGSGCVGCGGRGCVEAYASLLALYDALELPIEPGSLEQVDRLFAEGDARVLAWSDEAAHRLATALLAVENLFDPRTIVFGGRLPQSLLTRLMREAERRAALGRMAIKREHPVYRSARLGAGASVVGAATLPLYVTFSPDLDLVVARGKEDVVHER